MAASNAANRAAGSDPKTPPGPEETPCLGDTSRGRTAAAHVVAGIKRYLGRESRDSDHADATLKLPNGDQADLGQKLEDYVLNPAHREGRHKARVFESVLGLNLASRGVLRQAILEAAATSTDAELRSENEYGRLYFLSFPMRTEKGTAAIATAWIVRQGETFPRLTTCYIL